MSGLFPQPPEVETLARKLAAFRELVDADQRRSFRAHGYQERFEDLTCTATIKLGRKYANIDVGLDHARQGKYMVELDTGTIYGIKAYGCIHRGHSYGTLDTIHDWDWSDYRAVHKRHIHPLANENPDCVADSLASAIAA